MLSPKQWSEWHRDVTKNYDRKNVSYIKSSENGKRIYVGLKTGDQHTYVLKWDDQGKFWWENSQNKE